METTAHRNVETNRHGLSVVVSHFGGVVSEQTMYNTNGSFHIGGHADDVVPTPDGHALVSGQWLNASSVRLFGGVLGADECVLHSPGQWHWGNGQGSRVELRLSAQPRRQHLRRAEKGDVALLVMFLMLIVSTSQVQFLWQTVYRAPSMLNTAPTFVQTPTFTVHLPGPEDLELSEKETSTVVSRTATVVVSPSLPVPSSASAEQATAPAAEQTITLHPSMSSSFELNERISLRYIDHEGDGGSAGSDTTSTHDDQALTDSVVQTHFGEQNVYFERTDCALQPHRYQKLFCNARYHAMSGHSLRALHALKRALLLAEQHGPISHQQLLTAAAEDVHLQVLHEGVGSRRYARLLRRHGVAYG